MFKEKIQVELKKKFYAGGNVDPNKQFYIDPTPWNQKNLLPNLELGGFYTLLGPSQSGKTTKCVKLIEMIENKGEYLPIW